MLDLAQALDETTGRLLETMFFTSVLEQGSFTSVLEQGGPLPSGPRYTATLGFSGSREGSLMVSASHETAAALAASFLGDAGDVAEAASIVGELANILSGGLLGAVDRAGQFVIAPPEISTSDQALAQLDSMPLRRLYILEEGPLAVGFSIAGEAP